MTRDASTAAPTTDDSLNDARRIEWAACHAVVTFTSLTGGEGGSANPLWAMAEQNGWSLDDFVREVLSLTDSIACAAVDKGVHVSLEHECPCNLIRRIRAQEVRLGA